MDHEWKALSVVSSGIALLAVVYHSFSFPLERSPFSGLFSSKIRNPLFGFLSLDAEFKQVYACGLLALSVVLFEFHLPDGELSLLSPLGSISLTVFSSISLALGVCSLHVHFAFSWVVCVGRAVSYSPFFGWGPLPLRSRSACLGSLHCGLFALSSPFYR